MCQTSESQFATPRSRHDQQHVNFTTQELSNVAWSYAVLSSEGLLGTEADDQLSPWKPTAMLDAGEVSALEHTRLCKEESS